jgi:hypothetical protein
MALPPSVVNDVRIAARCRDFRLGGFLDSHKIGLGKVVALKEEQFPSVLSQGIGETVAEI